MWHVPAVACAVLLCISLPGGAIVARERCARFSPHGGPPPPVAGLLNLTVDDAAFVPMMPIALKNLNVVAEHVVIPPQSHGGLKINAMRLENMSASNASVRLIGPNRVTVHVWNVSAAVQKVNFSYTYWAFKWITCNGTARAMVRNSNASVLLNLSIGTDHLLNVTVGRMAIMLKDLDVKPSIKNCPVIDVVVDAIIRIFKDIITRQLQEIIPTVLGPMVENKTREVLRGLPVNFTHAPNITNGKMELPVTILPEVPTGGELPPEDASLYNRPHHHWDISILSSRSATNNVLRFLINRSLLWISKPVQPEYTTALIQPVFPKLYELCPNCTFAVTWNVTDAAWLEPLKDGGFVFNLRNSVVDVEMLASNGTRVDALRALLSTTSSVAQLLIRNGTLNIKIPSARLTLANATSPVGPINSTKLSADLQWILDDFLLPVVNHNQQGFSFSVIPKGLLFNATADAVAIGLDAASLYSLLSARLKFW